MADKKKSKGAGASKKAPVKEAAAKDEPAKDEAAKDEAATEEHASHDDAAPAAHAKAELATAKHDAHGAHAHGAAAHAAHAHGHKPNVREYLVIFVVLFVLTVIEVAVAQIPGISKTLLAIALIGLAVTKAACVGLYYMHLKHETKILKLTVALPFSAPVVYALVLIAEGAWRMARW